MIDVRALLCKACARDPQVCAEIALLEPPEGVDARALTACPGCGGDLAAECDE